MQLSLQKLALSTLLLVVLMLGTAMAMASAPHQTSSAPQFQSTSTVLPIWQTATAIQEDRDSGSGSENDRTDALTATADTIQATVDAILTGTPDAVATEEDEEATIVRTPTDPDEIENYAAFDYQVIVDELQEKEVIPIGGNLIYETNYAFYDGTGAFYTPLAEFRPHTNLIIGGELTFTTTGDSEDLELCGFLTRAVTTRFSANSFLLVGLDSEGFPAIVDLDEASGGRTIDFTQDEYNLDVSHFLQVILLDETLLLYIDGELVLENDELPVREGSHGLALIGEGLASRCEVNNIWIYELDNVWDGDDGVCGVTSSTNVNLREGPGVNFGIAGQLQGGEVLDVEGQTIAPDGFVWWNLTTGEWVRSDVVSEIGACEELAPEVEPEE